MQATVYSRKQCMQCSATYKRLEAAGIDYTVIDLDKDSEALAMIQAQGFTSLPVVCVNGDTWSGFRPDLIKAHSNQLELFPVE